MIGVDKLRLSVSEPITMGEPRRIMLELATEKEFGCSDIPLEANLARRRDTLRISVFGVRRGPWVCDNEVGPARYYGRVDVKPGAYIVEVRQGRQVSRMSMQVASTSLQLAAIGKSRVTPDTTMFLRAPTRGMSVVCSGNKSWALCDDVRDWVARQPGIHPFSFPASGRTPFWGDSAGIYSTSRYYTYDDDSTLVTIRNCMREVERRLSNAVGAMIDIETSSGEFMHAWSTRALNERHIDTPLRATGEPPCS
jgi:hypothetical protein